MNLDYMINKLGIEEEKVPEMCSQLYKDYGTTMAGLAVWFLPGNFVGNFKWEK